MSQQPSKALLQGLSEQQAIERLATDGYNELPTAQKRNFLHILLEVLHEPICLMLITCGVLYLFLGDQEKALVILRDLFQFAPLHRWEMALLFASALCSILFAESIKLKPIQKMIYRAGE